MGYAGYVPAKMPPSKASPVEAALWSIRNPETLAILGKLLKNTVIEPSEEKFRRIRLSNPKIDTLVRKEVGGVEALKALGWVEEEETDSLVVPKGKQFTMSQVRMIQDAEERLKKDTRTAKRSAAAAKLPLTKEQMKVKEQLEADRLERASKAPAPAS